MHILADLCETLLQNINSFLHFVWCFCNCSTRFSPKCKMFYNVTSRWLGKFLLFVTENNEEFLTLHIVGQVSKVGLIGLRTSLLLILFFPNNCFFFHACITPAHCGKSQQSSGSRSRTSLLPILIWETVHIHEMIALIRSAY